VYVNIANLKKKAPNNV